MYLVDTDVISRLRRPQRNPAIVQWLKNQRAADLFLSVITVGEIERGIQRQQQQDPEFANQLSDWLDRLLRVYATRILDFDLNCARHWGRLSAAVGNNSADLLIAATALDRGLTVVTGNVRHFERTGVPTYNPLDQF